MFPTFRVLCVAALAGCSTFLLTSAKWPIARGAFKPSVPKAATKATSKQQSVHLAPIIIAREINKRAQEKQREERNKSRSSTYTANTHY